MGVVSKCTASTTSTTCPYCGVGCGVLASVENEQLIGVAGDPAHPANHGRLCVKGSALAETQGHDTRLLQPYVDGVAVGWDAATRAVADRFMETVKRHGPDSVAFYLSGQLLTEDYYVANKLMKGFIGSANVDTNSRLCMASAVAAHKRAFGEDIVACDYADLDAADLIVLVGSNAAWAHPIAYQRMVNAVKTRGAEIIVIDPRVTSSCDSASLHLPIKPGSDVALFNGLLTYLRDNDLFDHSYIKTSTENLDECMQSAQLSLTEVSVATNLPKELLTQFYERFGKTRNTVTVFSQGVNQSVAGTDNANAIINCHLVTGKIGYKGAGPFSITGQPNAMGGREVGGMANQLAAHMDFLPEHVATVERFWQAPNIATKAGAKAVSLFDKMAQGEIKAVWIMATNPAVSLPDTTRVKEALARCDLVVVSDTVQQTDTSMFADILLPAAGWGEKDGTVTNSERCISRQRQMLRAPASARPDWQIIVEVARAMGYAEAFSFDSAYDIFKEHALLSGFKNAGNRLFDISALADISKNEYQQMQPFTWPLQGRPFEDGHFPTPSGKARLVAVMPGAVAQATNSDYPFVLNTGRLRDQWHTMTRTGTSAKLFAHQSEPLIEISTIDAEALTLKPDDLIRLTSRQGSLISKIKVTDNLPVRHLFMPIHWSEQFASTGSVGQLLSQAVDPVSGQPELKHGAVSVEPVPAVRWIRIFSKMSLPRSWLIDFHYWTRRPAPEDGWQLECAADDADAADKTISLLRDRLAKLWPDCQTHDYEDSVSHFHRRIALVEGELVYSVASAPLLQALPVILQAQFGAAQFRTPHHIQEQSRWRALTTLSGNQPSASPLVCTCFEVTEDAIASALSAGCETLAALGQSLKCGTNCGSCIPELNQAIRQHAKAAGSATNLHRVPQ